MKKQKLAVLLGVLVPIAIWAADLVLPHTFSTGDPIRASDMNENFAAIKAVVDQKADKGTVGGGGGLTRSGSRLKHVVMTSPDGLVSPVIVQGSLLWDSQLGFECYFYTSVRYAKCLPSNGVTSIFTDSTCSSPTRVITLGGGTYSQVLLDAGVAPYAIDPLSDGGIAVFAIGPKRPVSAIYNEQFSGLADGGQVRQCFPNTGGSGDFYTVGAEVPLSTFATVSFGIQ